MEVETTGRSATPSYRCGKCNIESRERSCFIGTLKEGVSASVVCITCAGRQRRIFVNLFELLACVCLPLLFLSIAPPSPSDPGFLVLLIIGCIMLAVVYAIHELAHFLTARLLGLRADLVVLGAGPKLFEMKFFGSLIRMHAFPLEGATYITSDSRRWLRLRLWLSVFAGPASNIGLAFITLVFWLPFSGRLGDRAPLLFLAMNILVALFSLVPSRQGIGPANDGKRLRTIPFKSEQDLDVYLRAADILRATLLFEGGQYELARAACLSGLERTRDDPHLVIALSACEVSLERYAAAIVLLEQFADRQTSLQAAVRAVLHNNLATALLLDEPATTDPSRLERLDWLSNDAFIDYPCVLDYRSTRALILATLNRTDEALDLLAYSNYQRGTAAERSNCEVSRAFALARLGRPDEAARAANLAIQLCESAGATLRRLNVAPPTT